MIKTIKLLLILTLVILLLCSCSDNTMPTVNENKTEVITSFYPLYVFTSNIVKDVSGVSISNMTQSYNGCLHDYQLTPKDLKNIEQCDLYIINGSGFEPFLDKLGTSNPSMKIIDTTSGYNMLTHDNENNIHIWVSMDGAKHQTNLITQALVSYDKANADRYIINSKEYLERLNSLQKEIQDSSRLSKSIDVIVFHAAAKYLSEDFNLNIVQTAQHEPDDEFSAQDLKRTVEAVREKGIKYLISVKDKESNFAEAVSRETGAKVLKLDLIYNGSVSDMTAYENKMRENLNILQEAYELGKQ